MHRACALLVACTLFAVAPAHARRVRKNDLLRVVTPIERSTVPAHPFVNVIVRFGQTSNGLPADPRTFRARLGRNDVGPLFSDIVENGVVVGKRAAIEPPLIHEGRAVNRLRLDVRSVPQLKRNGRPGRRRMHDIDRLRFRATPADDHAPVARITASTEVILPGIPVQFSASQSTDVDNDALAAHWDFGDGTVSDEWEPSKTFTDSTGDAFVTLTVSDRDLTDSKQTRLLATPPLCPGCTPGVLRIPTGQPLEFGAVAPGTSSALTFTVLNNDATATSDLHARVATDSGSIVASPADFSIGPGQTQDVTVTFAPTAPGHASANLTLVASVSNRPVVHLLAHGFGGSGPPTGACGTFTGPTFAPDLLFYSDLVGSTFGILPDGTPFCADNGVHACLASNGTGSLDLCTNNSDCVTAGETCAQSSTCIGGDRRDQVCITPADCPSGFCRSYAAAEPVDMCGDGTGGLYLITDIGTFTDPNPGDTELSTTIVRMQFDPATGARTAVDIVARATDQTNQITCDGFAPSAGGQVFVPEFFNVTVPDSSCARDQRETLTAFSKGRGTASNILPDVDAAGGYAECDDFDQASDLEVTRDASAIFVSLPATGLSRIRPTPLLISPDITDSFQLHPDGSVVYVTATDVGTSGSLKIYRISPDQAVHGAPHLSDLTPCATYQVPNNRWLNRGQTLLGTSSFAVDRAAPGSLDAIVLVSFVTTGGFPDVPRNLLVQGTLVIAAPVQSNDCRVLGFQNLQFLDPLTF